jgi:hypothetical protein
MDYIPALDGQYEEHISVKATHVDALLYELSSGQTELATLTAAGGIEYEDKKNEFFGSELFYDHKTAFVTVKGDKSTPCYYNGVPVDGIKMDMKTSRVEADIVGPGTLQMNR